MNTWFTADQHFGHKNIIQYCNRPFDSVDDMDDALTYQWNSVVDSLDSVYVLGDFTLGDYNHFNTYVGRLNGKINIVPGGHDHIWLNKYKKQSFRLHGVVVCDPIEAMYVHNSDGSYRQIIIMCHYAMRVWDRSHYNSWQLYGHSHGMLEPVGKQMDVGVDNIYKIYGQYRPINMKEVEEYMATRPDNPNYLKKGRDGSVCPPLTDELDLP